MNNKKYRPRISQIDIWMLLTDMDNSHYKYSGENEGSHNELRFRLWQLINKGAYNDIKWIKMDIEYLLISIFCVSLGLIVVGIYLAFII